MPRLLIYDQDNTKKPIDSYSVYKCLYFEIIDKDIWYFLESGIWYKVEKVFSDSIEADISDLLQNHLSFNLKYNKHKLLDKNTANKNKTDKYENWFNHELTNFLSKIGNSMLLDANNIQMDGYDKIEVCDVLFCDSDSNKFLFHNKYNYGSSSLSHLFSQGNVAATLLTNQSFRNKVNEKIDNMKLKFPMEDDNFNPKNYTIGNL